MIDPGGPLSQPSSDTLSVAQPTLGSFPWRPARRPPWHLPVVGAAPRPRRRAARYTQAAVPFALVAFEFDPLLRLGDRVVRLDTIVLAAVLLASLLVAARIAGRTPAGVDTGPFAHGDRLRIDDLVFVVLAIVPGAVIGGRIGYVVLHPGFYAANPGTIVDPAQGSLQLGLGIVGGLLSGGYGASLLGQPVGRWLHVAALPTLLAIGGGKVAMAIGGAGQGAPSDVPWATSYLGAGPWGSLGPAIPSHPSQLYEAVAVAMLAAGLVALLAAGGFARRDGSAFLVALAGWAVIRVIVGATWRDPEIIGVLRADQVISLLIAVGCVVAVVLVSRRSEAAASHEGGPQWPDPETRPHF
jgi:phosphatidylglycerol:prolipoprotein diacylglycerol transferase